MAMIKKQNNPVQIDKNEFYFEMKRMILSARQNIWLYSVSACFGFYSQGMYQFESLLRELKLKIDSHIDVRCLIKFDNHEIDQFAAKLYKRLNEKAEIVKELIIQEQNENIQFIMTDFGTTKSYLLYSRIQGGRKSLELDIDINELRDGVLYNFPVKAIDEYKSLFSDKWNSSSVLR